VLDPLVGLHGIDENHAGEVAELLGYFRLLQRQLGISVLLVHHTRKNAGDRAAAGQGLRSSGDIYAFSDLNLYLWQTEQHLILSSEYRSAPALAPVYLKLVATNAETTHLEVIAAVHDEKEDSFTERVLALLAPRTTADADDAAGFTGGQERAIRQGARVARAGRPDRPHVYWLAPSLLRIGEYRSVPHPQKGNGTILPGRNRASIILPL
jgi:hypothetical protein